MDAPVRTPTASPTPPTAAAGPAVASLRLLVVEDNEADYRLAVRGLSREFAVTGLRVETEAALRGALSERSWDAVLCDYNLPGFGAAQAIAVIREHATDLAVIVVSGAIGEDRAVELIRVGANDVVSKHNLARLPQALRREIDAAAMRAADRTAKRALRDSEERLRQANAKLVAANRETEMLLSSMSAILIGVDESGIVLRWNEAAEVAFGIPIVEAVGVEWLPGRLVADPLRLTEAMAVARSTGTAVALDDVRFRRPDGSDGFLAINVAFNPAADAGGMGSTVILATDITRRRALEAQLLQVQKMESVGQLAAGVAHEINTPTQFVGDNLKFLKKSFGEIGAALRIAATPATDAAAIRFAYLFDEIPNAIGEALEGVERIASIVRAMKDFSHPDSNEKQFVDVNRAIATTLEVARNEYKYVARVVTALDPDLPHVPGYAGIINQALLNIIVNAAHAIADAGRSDGVISISTAVRDAFVDIRVADNGTGIPEAIRGRIFDPFFTTKDVGRGTGQGLFIAHAAVVTKHGGSISIETEVGSGSTFVIRLPLPRDAA